MPRKNKTIKRKKAGGFPSMPGKKQREQYNRRQDRKARLAELEKLIGRLDDTNYSKLKRSLIRLSGRDPESSEYDEFQPWPTEDAYKDGSSLLLFDEEAKLKPDKIRSVGEIPSPVDVPPGCSFNTRCPFKTDICFAEDPVMREIEPEHYVRCHNI